MDTLTQVTSNGYHTSKKHNIESYRTLIKKLLNKQAILENSPPENEVDTHLIFDEERDHYMLFRTGWWEDKRIRAAALYVRLYHGKIWIEEDWTEEGLATDLLAGGVPREHIVLSFHHPSVRFLTEFAAC